jgi:hypothetical protein
MVGDLLIVTLTQLTVEIPREISEHAAIGAPRWLVTRPTTHITPDTHSIYAYVSSSAWCAKMMGSGHVFKTNVQVFTLRFLSTSDILTK